MRCLVFFLIWSHYILTGPIQVSCYPTLCVWDVIVVRRSRSIYKTFVKKIVNIYRAIMLTYGADNNVGKI